MNWVVNGRAVLPNVFSPLCGVWVHDCTLITFFARRTVTWLSPCFYSCLRMAASIFPFVWIPHRNVFRQRYSIHVSHMFLILDASILSVIEWILLEAETYWNFLRLNQVQVY